MFKCGKGKGGDMKNKQRTLTVMLALIIGLVGGVISSQFLMGETVFAEKPTHLKVLKAGKLELVDKEGNIFASLGQVEGGTWLRLSNRNGAFLNASLHDHYAVMSIGDEIYGRIFLEVVKDGPRLTLQDEKHNERAVLGSTQLKHKDTGRTETRAVSSLVLFGADGKVVWSAP